MSDQSDTNKILGELLGKAQLEQAKLNEFESIKRPSSRRRDVMVHVAVTILNRQNGVTVVGEKPNEICQYAVEIPATQFPIKMSWAKKTFEALTLHAYKKMLAFGLVRAD